MSAVTGISLRALRASPALLRHPIPLGRLIRQARATGAWNIARLPHESVTDMVAQLQRDGDHDEACRVTRESLHARIERAADAADDARDRAKGN